MKLYKMLLALAIIMIMCVGCGDRPQKGQNETMISVETSETAETEKEMVVVPAWKKAYATFIQNSKDFNIKDYEGFVLIFVDNDDVPELFLKGIFNGAGYTLLTQNENKEVSMLNFGMSNASECSYEPGSGLLYERFTRKDFGSITLYEVKEGEILTNNLGIQECSDGELVYTVKGNPVSEEDYKNCWKQFMDEEKTISLSMEDDFEFRSMKELDAELQLALVE